MTKQAERTEQQARRARKLRKTIDPATGKLYTLDRVAEIMEVGKNHVLYLTNPEHNLRRRRRNRMVRIVEEKFITIANEDWASAYALFDRLKAILKEASNV